MDSNSKLGRHFIPLDPHEQSANGKVLAGIIERNNLVVANGLNAKCVGAITRRRVTSKSTEESIIDHVIISCEYLESILIDEEGHHSLTKIFKNKMYSLRGKVIIIPFYQNSISPGKGIKHQIELKCTI